MYNLLSPEVKIWSKDSGLLSYPMIYKLQGGVVTPARPPVDPKK
jgi:hypothetical protein